MGNVEIGFSDFSRQQQAVVLHAPVLPELLVPLGSEHLAQRVRGVHGAVDQDVSDMDTPARILGIERLTEHAPPTHGRGVGVLSRIATNCRGC